MNSRKWRVCLACAGVAMLSAALRAQGEGGEQSGSGPETLVEALKAGKAAVSLRYRFEYVSDDFVAGPEAQASTLRTTLGYRSGVYRNFSLFAEAENVSVIGDDRYNNRGAGSLSNGVTDRPVVADPALTELNQAYLRWDDGETQVTVGRQEIPLGDQRFVGPVGWRQNHQSFDALRFVHRGVESWTFSYAFLDAVHRIFGDSQGITAHLLNAKYALPAGPALTLYGYLLDYDDPGPSVLSSNTFGAEFSGKRKFGDSRTLLYEVEWAQQSDAGDNPNDLDVGYQHAVLGLGLGKVTVRAGLERLEGGPQGAFRTPLATLHKFNGWADKFLATPRAGLEDLYLELGGKTAKGVAWAAIYHDFGATENGASYGEELDLLLSYKTSWNQTFGLKGALYDARDFAADTDKWMAWTAYGF